MNYTHEGWLRAPLPISQLKRNIPTSLTDVCFESNAHRYINNKTAINMSPWQTQNTISNTEIICIPRIESSINREYIYNTFHKLKIGYIEKLNEIPLRNEPTHKRIIIRIKLNNSETAYDIKNFLDELGSVKIVHNMPWFWRVVRGQS